VVVPAPLPVGVKPVHIVTYLRAMLTVLGGIAIDSCAIRLQSLVAVVRPIPVAKRCLTHREREHDRNYGTKRQPNHMRFHHSSSEYAN